MEEGTSALFYEIDKKYFIFMVEDIHCKSLIDDLLVKKYLSNGQMSQYINLL